MADTLELLATRMPEVVTHVQTIAKQIATASRSATAIAFASDDGAAPEAK